MKKLAVLLLLVLLLFTACGTKGAIVLPETGDGMTRAGETAGVVPWHLSVPCEWKIRSYEIPSEKKDLRFQVPLLKEGEVGGLSLKCEFFQESYSISEPLQLKLSITNHTGANAEIATNPGYLGYVTKDGGHLGNFYSIRAADLTDVDTPIYRELPAGETVIYESVFVGDPSSLELGTKYECCLSLCVKGAEELWSFSFPIDLVIGE